MSSRTARISASTTGSAIRRAASGPARWRSITGAGAGALYRLDPDLSVHRMVDGVAISNGLDWSPDGRTMYYVDTPTQRLDAFAFDPATGAIADRRTFATIDPADGSPDGLTVDAEGAHLAGVVGRLAGSALPGRRHAWTGRSSCRSPR